MSKYDDIINLPHHISKTRIPMSMENRATQFAPFSALNGHDEAINETARLTTEKPELSVGELDKLSHKLVYALERDAEICITYFKSDALKQGGAILQTHGKINKIDKIDGLIIIDNKQTIKLDCLLSIDGTVFNDME